MVNRSSSWTVALVVGAAVVLAGGRAVAEQPLAVVLGRWTTAVRQHTPGTSDAALASIWAMTPSDRDVVREHLHLFLTFLDGADFSKAHDDDLIVASIALSLWPMSRSDFVERAATLHADAVIFNPRASGPTAPDHPVARSGRGTEADSGQQAVFATSMDGEFLKTVIEDPNWPMGRLLLDALPPGAASQAFAATWYHGVTAYLLAHRNFGEAERNLDHATALMPNSAQALFDLGCVEEAFGMNLFQQVVLDDGDPQYRGRPGIISAPRTLPSAKTRDAEAARLFERALAIDPRMPEARVRRARLLELDKRWTDAARQIGIALDGRPDQDVAFFAHLFGARAANALDDTTNAETHLAQALALFPRAESAILEASHTALRGADPVLATSRLSSLADAERDGSPAADPWLRYPLGPGRLQDSALRTLWRAVPTSRAR